MLSAAFIAEMRELTTAIAPEVSQPLYLMDHPAALPLPSDCGGYAMDFTCSQLKAVLIELGEWFGPGPQIVLCGGDDLGVFIHELAHVLPFEPRRDAIDDPMFASFRRLTLTRWAAEPTIPADKPKWTGHDLDFIRTVCHLHGRVNMSGRMLCLSEIPFAGEPYGLSPSWKYLSALGDEPERMASKSFREILATPAPNSFLELWKRDIAQ